jgi:hypothetical protein
MAVVPPSGLLGGLPSGTTVGSLADYIAGRISPPGGGGGVESSFATPVAFNGTIFYVSWQKFPGAFSFPTPKGPLYFSRNKPPLTTKQTVHLPAPPPPPHQAKPPGQPGPAPHHAAAPQPAKHMPTPTKHLPTPTPEETVNVFGHIIHLVGTPAAQAAELDAAIQIYTPPAAQPTTVAEIEQLIHQLGRFIPGPVVDSVNTCLNQSPASALLCLGRIVVTKIAKLSSEQIRQGDRVLREIEFWLKRILELGGGHPVDPPLPVNARFGKPCGQCETGIEEEEIY